MMDGCGVWCVGLWIEETGMACGGVVAEGCHVVVVVMGRTSSREGKKV